MAEYCSDCFSILFKEKQVKRKYVLSKEPDLCEGCGEWKNVVVRIKNPRLFMLKRKFRAIFKK